MLDLPLVTFFFNYGLKLDKMAGLGPFTVEFYQFSDQFDKNAGYIRL